MAFDEESFSFELREDRKIFRSGDYIMGFCGSYRVGQILRNFGNFPDLPKNLKNPEKVVDFLIKNLIPEIRDLLGEHMEDSEPWSLVIACREHFVIITDDLQVGYVTDDYSAIGAGENVALGALSVLNDDHFFGDRTAMERAVAGVYAASLHNSSVGGNIHVYDTTGEEETYYVDVSVERKKNGSNSGGGD
jgi:ATP-dependent protease HslVU (ClpYQ) peptidase subunit